MLIVAYDCEILSNSFNIKFHHIQASSLFDVDAVDAHEGIDDGLASVGDDGVTHTLSHDLDCHTRLNTNTVNLFTVLRGNLKHCHNNNK